MRSNKILVGSSLVATIILFHFIYDLSILIPANIGWLLSAMHDWGGHYIGWYVFRYEDWQFPLGNFSRLIFPVGTNIGFTDSIPLLAVPLKLFSWLLPEDFQYFGMWLFLSHILAAFFTIKLLTQFKINKIFIFFAVILIVANPVLIYRGMHPALTAHWVLIASLYIYFLQTDNPQKTLFFQLLILLIASWISPYLAIMVLGFNFILSIRLRLQKSISTQLAFVYGGFAVFTLIASWFLLGFFTFNNGTELAVSNAYGLYSLNLNSLFNSFGFSTILPQLSWVSPHQYEGYAYLGIGIMMLSAIAFGYFLVNAISKKVSGNSLNIKNYGSINLVPLYILLIAYTLFSITHIISVGDKVLFAFNIPDFLLHIGDILRASSRFFWIVYYLIIFISIIIISKSRINHYLKVVIMVLVIVIQFYDLQPIFNYRKLTNAPYETNLQNERWLQTFSNFSEIIMYPPYQPSYLTEMDHQHFCFLSAKARKPISAGYVPRSDLQAQENFSLQIKALLNKDSLSANSLIIVTESHIADFAHLIFNDKANVSFLDGYYLVYLKQQSNERQQIISEITASNEQDIISRISKKVAKNSFSEIPFKLSSESGLKVNVENFNSNKFFLKVSGWAFIEEKHAKTDSTFITLVSNKKTYLLPADQVEREDVATHFRSNELVRAGFAASANLTGIQRGGYNLAIAIKKQGGQWFTYFTDHKVNIGDDFVLPMLLTTNIPKRAIKGWFDNIEVENNFINAAGWGFFVDRGMENIELRVVLKKDDLIYTCETEQVLRPDLTPYFNSPHNLSNAGFKCKINKNSLAAGEYKLGLFLKDPVSKTEGIFYSDKIIKI